MEETQNIMEDVELDSMVVVKIDCHEAGLNAPTSQETETKHRHIPEKTECRSANKGGKVVEVTRESSVVLSEQDVDRQGVCDKTVDDDEEEEESDDDEDEFDEDDVDNMSTDDKHGDQRCVSKRLMIFFTCCVMAGVLLVVVVMFNVSEKPEMYMGLPYVNGSHADEPPPSNWAKWSRWSECSATCGSGETSRSRTQAKPYDREDLRQIEIEECTLTSCPVLDRALSDWTEWDSCTVTCGPGKQTRIRYCTDPTASPGTEPCLGATFGTRNCSLEYCPVDGVFSPWSDWNTCSATCGVGRQIRHRYCSNPAPQHGGRKCAGQSVNTRTCKIANCPVDGRFTAWSLWSKCSVSCGTGRKNRARSCSAPAPRNSGKYCDGHSRESEKCNNTKCPVNGEYSPWSVWMPCTASCGTGNQARHRTCDNPLPAFGGSYCIGPDLETKACNTKDCPVNPPCDAYKQAQFDDDATIARRNCHVDGAWSVWTEWSSCTKSCGAGTGHSTRSRNCSNPSPQHGGNDCPGDTVEIKGCPVIRCPDMTKFDPWTEWSPCRVTCGKGVQFRTRVCPVAEMGTCSGHKLESQPCNVHTCPEMVVSTTLKTTTSASIISKTNTAPALVTLTKRRITSSTILTSISSAHVSAKVSSSSNVMTKGNTSSSSVYTTTSTTPAAPITTQLTDAKVITTNVQNYDMKKMVPKRKPRD